jgi:hypothetical protein
VGRRAESEYIDFFNDNSCAELVRLLDFYPVGSISANVFATEIVVDLVMQLAGNRVSFGK